jgi:F-type H+-transporting ATPase subunit delta
VGALFAAAQEQGLVDNIHNLLETLNQAFRDVPDLTGFVHSPEIPSSRKLEVLGTIVGTDAPDTLKRFFQLVLNKNREAILPNVFDAYHRFREESLGRVQVQVTTAVEVSEDIKANIIRGITGLTAKTPVVSWAIDPDLLGGYRILVENRCYDFSLIRQVNNLRERLSR